MPTDIEIANAAKPFKISRIAAKLDLTDEDIIPYGHYMAKISRAKTAAFARPATPATRSAYTSPNQNLCRSHAKGSESANIAYQPKLVAQPRQGLEECRGLKSICDRGVHKKAYIREQIDDNDRCYTSPQKDAKIFPCKR